MSIEFIFIEWIVRMPEVDGNSLLIIILISIGMQPTIAIGTKCGSMPGVITDCKLTIKIPPNYIHIFILLIILISGIGIVF